jgi:Na+-translocating ferredoxin:NAD+ oxidoreductase RnfE subunit
MLQPYFSSRQVTGMISGLPVATSYESLNDSRPGMARTYWDAFGVGMMMAVFLIVLGSLWSVYSGIRASRMKTVEE